MEIYILRHAIAVERGTPGYDNDSARPLTAQGRTKMIANAKGMKAMGLQFDVILSSPFIRAAQTAEIVTRVLNKMPEITHTKNLTPDAAFKDLVKEIKSNHPKAKSILLVGHEPHLSGLMSYLLVGTKMIPIEFKKGGLAYVTTEKLSGAGCAVLQWLLSPSQLRSFIHRPQGRP